MNRCSCLLVSHPVAGPPVAVSRTIVGALPATIVLDGSTAMVPSRSLADVQHVLVTARVARSGTANRTSGDVEGVFGPVAVADPARGEDRHFKDRAVT